MLLLTEYEKIVSARRYRTRKLTARGQDTVPVFENFSDANREITGGRQLETINTDDSVASQKFSK